MPALAVPPAAELLAAAMSSVYRWPADFPGFTATLTLRDGGAAFTGRLRVDAALRCELAFAEPRRPTVDLDRWVRHQLASLVARRRHDPRGHGACRVVEPPGDRGRPGVPAGSAVAGLPGPPDGPARPDRYDARYADSSPNPLGPLIAVSDEFDSTYRVLHGQVTEIVRHLPDMTVHVHVLERVPAPDERLLPRRVLATYSHLSGRITRVEVVDQTWAQVGGHALPRRRSVLAQDCLDTEVRALEFTELRVGTR